MANNQKIYVSPHNAKLFDFNTIDSRVYLAREINQTLNAIGNDCVIYGLVIDRSQTLFDSSTGLLTVTLTPGRIIIDSTLIEFEDVITLNLYVTPYDLTTGQFVIFVNYRYLEHTYENLAKMRLLYIDKNHFNDTFQENSDRIVLGTIKIQNDMALKIYSKSHTLRPNTITVNSKTFDIYPRSILTQSIIEFNTLRECCL